MHCSSTAKTVVYLFSMEGNGRALCLSVFMNRILHKSTVPESLPKSTISGAHYCKG